ncbi:Uncharacterised protein [Bordetella pertussis]|nr:Uncharacterised protein [Bordetella pertussis]
MRSIKGWLSPRGGLTPFWQAGIEGVRRGACPCGGRHAEEVAGASPRSGTGTEVSG